MQISPPQQPVISTHELTKIYRMGDTEVRALHKASISIHPGELTTIMGPSGSGKSTLMHLIGCLDTPTSGHILIDGIASSNMTERQLAQLRNQKIGFIFQQFNLLNRTSILENVAAPLLYAGIPLRQRRERAAAALSQVGLANRLQHRPNELSGGQKQRAAIARAIVTQPALLLADEPTGALDTATGDQILELFQHLNAAGLTVVMVTHDPEVSSMTRRTITIRDGKIDSDTR